MLITRIGRAAPSFSKPIIIAASKGYKRNPTCKAVTDFNRAIEIDPAYLSSYLNRARAYKKLKSYTKALKDFEHCIQKNPEFKEAYYQRGILHSDRRHDAKAATDFRAALKLSPKDIKLSFKVAESYYKAGKYNKADC